MPGSSAGVIAARSPGERRGERAALPVSRETITPFEGRRRQYENSTRSRRGSHRSFISAVPTLPFAAYILFRTGTVLIDIVFGGGNLSAGILVATELCGSAVPEPDRFDISTVTGTFDIFTGQMPRIDCLTTASGRLRIHRRYPHTLGGVDRIGSQRVPVSSSEDR